MSSAISNKDSNNKELAKDKDVEGNKVFNYDDPSTEEITKQIENNTILESELPINKISDNNRDKKKNIDGTDYIENKENNTNEEEEEEDYPHTENLQPFIGNLNDVSDSHEYTVDNKYILRGYRIHFNSTKRIFKSLFMIHNESFNIWSHFGGCILSAVLLVLTFACLTKFEFIHMYSKLTGYYVVDFHKNKNDFNNMSNVNTWKNNGYFEDSDFYYNDNSSLTNDFYYNEMNNKNKLQNKSSYNKNILFDNNEINDNDNKRQYSYSSISKVFNKNDVNSKNIGIVNNYYNYTNQYLNNSFIKHNSTNKKQVSLGFTKDMIYLDNITLKHRSNNYLLDNNMYDYEMNGNNYNSNNEIESLYLAINDLVYFSDNSLNLISLIEFLDKNELSNEFFYITKKM